MYMAQKLNGIEPKNNKKKKGSRAEPTEEFEEPPDTSTGDDR